MIPAHLLAIVVGTLLLLGYLYAWRFPDRAWRLLDAYPRSVWPGRVLTAVCLVWFARNLWQVDFGGLNEYKQILYIAVPVGFGLIVWLIPDLLSVRALFCLVLLAGNPLLIATRWQGTPASIAVGVFIYLAILKAMILVVYPHLWKRGLVWLYAEPARLRRGLIAGAGFSTVLLLCGLLSLA